MARKCSFAGSNVQYILAENGDREAYATTPVRPLVCWGNSARWIPHTPAQRRCPSRRTRMKRQTSPRRSMGPVQPVPCVTSHDTPWRGCQDCRGPNGERTSRGEPSPEDGLNAPVPGDEDEANSMVAWKLEQFILSVQEKISTPLAPKPPRQCCASS